MGTRWGVTVFVLDGIKGAAPAAAGVLLDTRPGAYALVAAAVLGHTFPVTRGFRGGKGVATIGGAVVVLHSVVFLILLAVWLLIRWVTGKASIGSLVIALGLPVGIALSGSPGWEVAATVGLAVLVVLRHTDNIRRLVGHSELRG